MASGTGYRCKNPARDILDFDSSGLPCDSTGILTLPRESRSRASMNPLASRFPLEILQEILLDLDLASLGMLRLVDTVSECLVDSLPAYSLLKAHASEALCLMYEMRCTSYFSIRKLFSEFCNPRCLTCSDFGPFLYIPNFTRCCYKCNFTRHSYELARVSDIRFRFGLSEKDLQPIPIIYNLSQPLVRLARIAPARALGKRIHGSKEEMDRAYEERVAEHRKSYERRMEQWENDNRQGIHRARPRFRPVRQQLGIENDETCLCLNATEEGMVSDWTDPDEVWHAHPPSREAYYRAFLEDDLPEHFRTCTALKRNYDLESSYVWPDDYRRERIDFIVRPKDTPDLG
ncbi:hypothetical protein BO94DRAFT_602218 [Aspergillus sclerotioniger CBS 115572]|uniref:F-box domain-containing protein n=1 Tax=Aspergillus sclerotioniger CBS 115572 TaxID=1450535 RepID=A0A317W6B0_9EURO|nr:hypothetical protein BO94DRAFT_602218 [Aspergillus sclerotioniger CBS 115572]PWY80842.1 hypothetical protein BO94DRAFT_602218 [Aspergillus sclerotioniger CBS 115572]